MFVAFIDLQSHLEHILSFIITETNFCDNEPFSGTTSGFNTIHLEVTTSLSLFSLSLSLSLSLSVCVCVWYMKTENWHTIKL